MTACLEERLAVGRLARKVLSSQLKHAAAQERSRWSRSNEQQLRRRVTTINRSLHCSHKAVQKGLQIATSAVQQDS